MKATKIKVGDEFFDVMGRRRRVTRLGRDGSDYVVWSVYVVTGREAMTAYVHADSEFDMAEV